MHEAVEAIVESLKGPKSVKERSRAFDPPSRCAHTARPILIVQAAIQCVSPLKMVKVFMGNRGINGVRHESL